MKNRGRATQETDERAELYERCLWLIQNRGQSPKEEEFSCPVGETTLVYVVDGLRIKLVEYAASDAPSCESLELRVENAFSKSLIFWCSTPSSPTRNQLWPDAKVSVSNALKTMRKHMVLDDLGRV